MKAKAMRLSYILPLLMMGGITFFTGCEQGKDLYNPDLLQEEAKKAFPVKDIDPDHTWETSVLCNATVSVNEKAGDTYTIKVYTANPYNTNGNAALLATTTVADGNTANFKFDIPAALQQVYVMKVNEEGYSAAVPATVEDGILKADFGGKDATTTRTVMTRNAITRAEIVRPEIPKIIDTDIFPTEVPTGYKEYKNNWEIEGGANYLITNNNANKINCDKAASFYIKGEVNLEKIYTGGNEANSKIFILPGATLTINQYNSNVALSVCPGATLKCNEFDVSGTSHIYNAGTIEIENSLKDSRQNGDFFNLGTLKFKDANLSKPYFSNSGTISAKSIDINSSAILVNETGGLIDLSDNFCCNKIAINEGVFNTGRFQLVGNGEFINEEGNVNITGHTEITANNSKWINNGYFQTNTMEFQATSPNWINSCKLIVKDKLSYITNNQYGLIMDADSYAECDNLYANQANIRMRKKAFFYVKGEAQFEDNPQGFIAEGNEYALLKMEKATMVKQSNNHIHYKGKLYVACDSHFEKDADEWNANYTVTDDVRMTGAENADITIPKSECNPGYGGTPDGGGSGDKVATFAYGFEDMSKDAGTDYDFNDVVLYVSVPYYKEDGKYVDVTLKAAGASKALSVKFKEGKNENSKERVVFPDVHKAMNVTTGTLVNTGGTRGKEATESINVSENFNLTSHGDFYITEETREIHIPAFTDGFKGGDVPYAIRVANNEEWKWPKERISIEKAYSGFANWAKDATQELDWYNTPVEENVMDNN